MSECPIFLAAQFMETTWREIDRLAEFVRDGLSAEGFEIEFDDRYSHDDDSSENRRAHCYKLRRVYKHQKRPAELMLYFDLARSGESSGWKHGYSALLVVAYSTLFEYGWDVGQLAFEANGAFEDEDSRAKLRPSKQSGNRFQIWSESPSDKGKPWCKRDWAFAVELTRLGGPDEAYREVVRPLVALLRNGGMPETIFADTSAIQWPER